MKKSLPLATAALLAFSLHAQSELSHRKADLTVQVQTESGSALSGATVEIEMLNHAFRFGCAVELHLVDPDAPAYDPTTVANLQKYFNSTTYGNVMKWTYYEARTEQQNLDLAALPMTFSAFEGPDPLRLRGHVTIWGAEYQVPNRVKNSNDPAYIHEQILSHIDAYHTTFKDSGIDNFDLYNEHFHEREFLIEKIIPNGTLAEEAAEVAEWFNQAKAADPNAILFINDYNILNASWVPDHGAAREYKEFIDAVRDAGGQLEGIGLQAHMDRMVSKEDLAARLAILAAPMEPTENHPEGLPGLPIEITELDINPGAQGATTEEDQAILARNVLEAAFEHPSVLGVTVWGMNDGDHWRSNALIFDDSDPDNWVLKQSGQVYLDKVLDEWWSDHAGSTAESGDFEANAFKGTHRVTVTFAGETKEIIVNLVGDQTVTFNFAAEASDAASYDAWAAFIDWELADSSRTADPDNDGRDNFSEFVFGTEPLSPDFEASPTLLLKATEADLIEFSVRARSEGLTIQLEKSTDLQSWTPIESLQSGVDIAEGIARQTLRFNDSDLEPSPEEGSVFYRVKFTEASAQ